MTRSVDLFFIDQEQRRHARIQLLNAKLEKYLSALLKLVANSETKLDQVTSQYLVLRHNARIAREVLMQNLYDISCEKEKLINMISMVRTEVEAQLNAADDKFEGEMTTAVSQMRSDVIRCEEQLEQDWSALEEERNLHNTDHLKLGKTEKSLKLKLKRLTTQRIMEISQIETELKLLRQTTHNAELEELHGCFHNSHVIVD